MSDRRRSEDEKENIQKLAIKYPNLLQTVNGEFFMENGKLIHKSKASPLIPSLDAIARENHGTYLFSCKNGQEIDGTAQHNLFMELIREFIPNAPDKNSNSNITAVISISGKFWIKKRSHYKRCENDKSLELPDDFSLIDILNAYIKKYNKRVIIEFT